MAERQQQIRRESRLPARLALLFAALVLLLLLAHALFAWRLNTSHMQQRLEAAVARGTDSLYRVRIGSSRFSLLGRSFTLTDFELYPDTGVFRRRLAAGRPLHTRYLVTARMLRAEGLGLLRFFRRQLWARTALIDSLRMEIEVDRTKPSGPTLPVQLPHQALREGQPYRLDQIRVTRGTVSFFERAIDGRRFGRLPFTDVDLLITNATNDRLRMSIASPAEIDVRARFAGASAMLGRFEYDLAAPGLDMTYRVSFGRMDAKALNAFLVDLEGVRIREGQLDSAVMQADVRNDVVRGQLLLLYHDLEVETLDKVSRDRDLSDKVQTFIFNHFKLKTDNPSNDGEGPPVVATVSRRRAPETPLFKFLWYTLRDGVFQTLGL